jgi:tagatose-6-phosphate ketose/aldose isomerase
VSDSPPKPNLTPSQAEAAGAYWTTREIAQQPALWPEIGRSAAADASLRSFLAPLVANPALRIVLAGAGTSSFVGRCLAPSLARRGRRADAIATTDIVADPSGTLARDVPTLMVHFARSGNSPESIAAMELAEKRVRYCAHLVVTCNAEGELYRRAGAMHRAHPLLLPGACNDQSFAMTSSFTGMLLAAGVVLEVLTPDDARLERLTRLGAQVLANCPMLIESLVRAQFERIVYLGAGELGGLALEAALKMLELTDGRVPSLGESPLAFRHGPKTFLNGSTLVVAFLSNDAYRGRYDLDLIKELERDGVAGRVITLTGRADLELRDFVLLRVGDGAAAAGAPPTDLELCLPYALFAQTLALRRSLSLGLTPDSPNAAGTVSRVVQGVSIYPWPGER